MKIGFDAKRAYHNHTGLGHYSRNLVNGLCRYFPEHEYFLFNPRKSDSYQPACSQVREVNPVSFMAVQFPSMWRRTWMVKDLQAKGIELYHGLSHELPLGIEKTGIKTAVTIHDLIFERYPDQYGSIDIKIYKRKFRHACEVADSVIAISEQTKRDLEEMYNVPSSKITVLYQGCNQVYSEPVTEAARQQVKTQFNLPDRYLLYVGSIVERKNLLNICKALAQLPDQEIKLVVVGDGGAYKQKVLEYIAEANLTNRVVFLKSADGKPIDTDQFPALYQQAEALVYPSTFEGFGIPVLEALTVGTPVVTADGSCFRETAGDAALFVDPFDVNDLAHAMQEILQDNTLRSDLISKGLVHAAAFTQDKIAANMMAHYQQLLNGR
jgi:glycosyltransferase involved in cell wall biosynthesis